MTFISSKSILPTTRASATKSPTNHRHRWWPFSISLALLFGTLLLTICLLVRNISTCYSGWAWHYTNRCLSGTPHPWASVAPPDTPPSIAIAMIVDDFLTADLRNATIANKERYARKWGYDVVVPSTQQVRAAAPGVPVAWAKFPLLLHLLEEYEYVLMIDADAVFMRDDIGLHAAAEQMQRDKTSLLISNDLNGPNSGVFMLRCGAWAETFLRQAVTSSGTLSAKTALLPLRFENRAFFYLLDAWPTCGNIRRFDSLLAPVHPQGNVMKRGVTTVDRCLINRRPRRATDVKHFFLNTGAAFDDIEDAFIAHAAGGNVTEKERSMRLMLTQAFQRPSS